MKTMNAYQNQSLGQPVVGTPKLPPEIQTCFGEIDSSLELLMKNVSGLASKIHAVCRSSAPEPAIKPPDRVQRHTEIGERLNKIQETIAEQSRAVADLADRVEL
jgi:hypothetical protein